jgi:hypothetical protein
MAQFQGILGRQASTTGPQTVVIGNTIFNTSNTAMWYAGCFGLSVTTVGTMSFSCYVVGEVGGIQVPIAGLSSIGSTTATLLPLIHERIIGTQVGTTQSALSGIPTPRSIVFGNSALAGQTYGAVVSAILFVS